MPDPTRGRDAEALGLEALKRLVEGAWRQSDPRELLDVLRERVAVLRATRQAREDQRRRAGVATEASQLRGRCSFGHRAHHISAADLSWATACAVTGQEECLRPVASKASFVT